MSEKNLLYACTYNKLQLLNKLLDPRIDPSSNNNKALDIANRMGLLEISLRLREDERVRARLEA